MHYLKITLIVTEVVTFIIPFYSLYFCFRPYSPSYMRTLPIYLFGNAVTEALTFYPPARQTATICYTIFELVYFAYFLSQIIRSVWVRKTIGILAVLFVLSMLYGIYTHNKMYTNFWADIVISCILIFPCLYYFKEILAERKMPDLLRDSSFWMIVGTLYYFLMTIPIYLFTMYFQLHNGNEMADTVWATNDYAELISFALYIYAMQCGRRRSEGVSEAISFQDI
jgi:hypothetical protein